MTNLIKVSKESFDVLGTAGTVPDNLNYSSDYNTLKYHINGSTSLSLNNSGTTTMNVYGTIAHNLGYAPFFICYVAAVSGTSAGSGTTIGTLTFNVVPYYFGVISQTLFAGAYVDSTNIYFKLTNRNCGDKTANFYYKIFRNNLGL